MPTTPTHQQRLDVREKPDSAVVMQQDWGHLLFHHWEYDPDEIQKRLPNGVYVDTYGGKAYLGVVPFFMEKVRPSFCPSIPRLSWFQELNLRTYAHDKHGRPGVWFFTLDCNQWLAVKLARTLFHLDYNHAKMSAKMASDKVIYKAIRKGDDIEQVFHYPYTLQAQQIAQPDTLDFFLLERYRLFSQRNNGNLYEGLVHHTPYVYQHLRIQPQPTRLFSLCGFDEPSSAPLSSIAADRVSVKIHPLTRMV